MCLSIQMGGFAIQEREGETKSLHVKTCWICCLVRQKQVEWSVLFLVFRAMWNVCPPKKLEELAVLWSILVLEGVFTFLTFNSTKPSCEWIQKNQRPGRYLV